MSLESLKNKKLRASEIIQKLTQLYPNAQCSLKHTNPYELLIATILSAQCTDERVNKVTPPLFDRYPNIITMAEANRDELISIIRSTGFFNNKADNIIACCKQILAKHHALIPTTLEELTNLKGVGRKTANVVLGEAFHIPGIVVDTHVGRLSRHLGLTKHTDPTKVEFELMKIFDKEVWTFSNHLMIDHGRAICKARKPDCLHCGLRKLCPGPLEKK